MRCPYCGFRDSKVIDSRPTDEGEAIRRRRECMKCEERFTTYEKVESLPIMVIKKDRTRELFDRDKLIRGITRACEKRPVSTEQIDEMAEKIESSLQNALEREVTSNDIGEKVMAQLKDIDEVAYVRFASVYRQFTDATTFIAEVNKLLVDRT
ncbi:MAG: transcriptional repressor NrdR [Oscillospiraceae bacterium]|nr:transcriptional repressor NrdR [Oscillospiraceae bacterium]